MIQTLKRFIMDETGLETVEYAIILGLIVAGTIVLVVALGSWVQGKFQYVVDELEPYSGPPG